MDHNDHTHDRIQSDQPSVIEHETSNLLSNSSRHRRMSVSSVNENANSSGQRSFYNLYR